MSELIVIGYPSRDQATVVLDTMRRLEIAWLESNDIAVIFRDKKGNLQMPELRQLSQRRVIPWSALWRGLLQSSPTSGRSGTHSVTRQPSALGIPNTFVGEVGAMIAHLDSALVIWVRTSLPPRVSDYLCTGAADVVRASLAAPQEGLLTSVLDVLGPSA